MIKDRFDIATFTSEALDRVLEMRQAGGLSLFSGEAVDHAFHQRLISDKEHKICYARSIEDHVDNDTDVLVFQLGYILDMADSEDFADKNPELWQSAYDYVYEYILKCHIDGINHREAFRAITKGLSND